MTRQNGERIIFDSKTGNIIQRFYEESGDVLSRPYINGLDYIDLPYGYVDSRKHEIIAIDPVKRKPILRNKHYVPTQEEVIAALKEEILLWQYEAEIGGVM